MSNDVVASELDAPDSALDFAIRSVLAEPLPGDAIQRVTARALNLARSSAPEPTRIATPMARRWKSPRMIAGSFAAAAVIAVAVLDLALLTGPSGNRGFAQMIEKVAAARTMQFYGEYFMGSHSASGPVYVKGNRTRSEIGDGTSISDLDGKTVLHLDTAKKRYQRIALTDELANEAANAVARLRRIKSHDAQLVREEEIDGRPTLVYKIDKANIMSSHWHNTETMVWVDAESNLPAKIVTRSLDPNTRIEVTLAKFVWDAPLDPTLFSLEVPPGYAEIVDLPVGPVEAVVPNQRNPAP